MLDNIINSPNPTEAEILDISKSIIDNPTDTMLLEESTIGNTQLSLLK